MGRLIEIVGHLDGQPHARRELGRPGEGVAPNWMQYFTTESAGKALARAEELGGSTLMPATQIPAGTIASVRDPQGAVFSIFEGDVDD